jgi:3-deoxy-manno-octulosonate cytidylyltransferase (CMP-KDO synthetase)
MIIIPARLDSSRFNKKILADIFGVPMAIATALRVCKIDNVIIATDCDELCDMAKKYNIKTYKSTTHHESGTDRINEVANDLNLSDDEIIINVQADEPFIEPEIVLQLQQNIKKLQIQNIDNFIMASCFKMVNKKEAINPNLVKVVINKNNKALYFSRSIIPFNRDECDSKSDKKIYKAHLGLYAFDKKSLNIFCNLNTKKLQLEHKEKLEQLRVLESAYDIHMIEVKSKSFGIDTKQDLELALKIYKPKM